MLHETHWYVILVPLLKMGDARTPSKILTLEPLDLG
jgi:hypothetical protein